MTDAQTAPHESAAPPAAPYAAAPPATPAFAAPPAAAALPAAPAAAAPPFAPHPPVAAARPAYGAATGSRPAAPARPTAPARGPRTRSGNGMTRSRACILSGAAKCIARYGTRKTTMGDIAREGAVAKGTLYNHFRTKPDVYAALLADEVDDLLTQVAALPHPAGSAEGVVAALAFAAEWLSEHPVLRALREREPETAARLAQPSDAPAWVQVRGAAVRLVSLAVAAGTLHPQTDPAVAADSLLRWLVSHVGWPADAAGVHAAARQVVHGLLAAPYDPPAAAPAAPAQAAPAHAAAPAEAG